jgi:8-oxo-dGTP pyrophosphatase MutT (NUDIX family)
MRKAVGIALVKGDQVLFQKRDNKTKIMPLHWGLLCGELEKNETPKEAIVRECREETGYQLKNPVYFATDLYQEKRKKAKVFLFYERYDGQQKIDCHEGEKMEFRNPKNFKKNEIIPHHDEYAQIAVKKIKK